ncbi:MAG: pyridoxal phosphate-dependent aminotransferase [Gammaproteobacteria bacterium]
MDIKFSQRVAKVKPSPTMAVTARAKELRDAGRDVIGLGAGEPDFDTPEHVKQAAIRAIENGQTKYTPVGGTIELKQAVVDKFARENDLTYQLNEILVSVGGKQSFYNLVQALVDEGDEVLIPAPYWVSYPDIVLLAGGTPVYMDTDLSTNFKITPEQLRAAITPATRLIVINSPSNPTGSIYSLQELQALGEVLLEHPQIWIATDDMYEHIRWTGQPYSNIVNACPPLQERTLVLNGVSKAYAMTGWRIGYAAGDARVIAAMAKVQSQSTSNPCSISQAAAVAALNGDQGFLQEMVPAFQSRHDFVVAALQDIPGIECNPAQGAFYSFPSMRGVMDKLGIEDDVTLCEQILEQAEVALVPGSAFGVPGYVRISYATDIDTLKEAMSRLAAFVNG